LDAEILLQGGDGRATHGMDNGRIRPNVEVIAEESWSAGIVLATPALGIGGTGRTSTRNRRFNLFYTGSLSTSKIGAIGRGVSKPLIFGKVEELRPPREGAIQPAWFNAISTGA